MKLRRLATLLPIALAPILLSLGLAVPATAATVDEKLAVMSSWSQTSRSSYNAWNSARLDQSAWAEYEFDWSTDYCSTSPDRPLGFDFRLSCQRHDFGYRNYRAMDRFGPNKARLDDAFYADLRAKCNTYNSFVRPACTSLAWTYYQAVSLFGDLRIEAAALQRAALLKAEGERAARLAAARDAV